MAVTAALLLPVRLMAQTCTTQANLTGTVRTSLADAALALGNAVQSGDAAKVQTQTVGSLATNFAATADLIHSTASALDGDLLSVTQLYELNASNEKPGSTGEADFTCPLTGTTSETDFAIPALPPGVYGFAMVSASGGARPWLLAFLLQQQGESWKMAGFYPRARTAAGRDGLWYWRAARDAAKKQEPWLATLFYGEAVELLRPANFVSSTNLDLLQSEQKSTLPPELLNGVSPEAPLVIKAAAGNNGGGAGEYRFTGMTAAGSQDGKTLDLILHLRLPAGTDPAAPSPAAARARNTAAAAALLDAHRDLRPAFSNVWVFAESGEGNPFATEEPMDQIP